MNNTKSKKVIGQSDVFSVYTDTGSALYNFFMWYL